MKFLHKWLFFVFLSLCLGRPAFAQDTTSPTQPATLTVTAVSTTQLDLVWSAATDNVAVTGYYVYRRSAADGPDTLIYTMTGNWTNYSNGMLLPGEKFWYSVKARDAAGNVSASSPLVSGRTLTTTDAIAPTAPTTLTVSAVSTTQLNLVWGGATDNVAVTGYEIYRRSAADGPDTLIYTMTGNWTNYTNGMLLPNQKFWYSVKARDGSGNVSPASSLVSGRTLASTTDTSVPTAPTITAVTAVSSSQLNLTWSAATDDVGVTGYRVYYRTTSTGADVLLSTLGNVLSTSNTGLTPDTKRWYSVSALDAAGNEGAKSALLSGRTLASATDATAPSVPTMTAVTAVSSSQLNLTWSAATDNVGVTGYRVYYRTTSTGADVLLSTLGNVLSASNTGLAPDTKRWYSVSALDAAGNEGAKSALLSGRTLATALDATAPTVPGNPTATPAATTQINLAWTASTDPAVAGQATSGLAGYRVERCQGASCTGFAEIASPTGTSMSNTGLTAGTAYRYRFRAVDVAGNFSGYSGIVSATTTAAPAPDTTLPSVAMTSPTANAVLNGATTSCAGASDNVGVVGVRFQLDGVNLGSEVTTSPYCVTWNTSITTTGPHTLSAVARDAAGNTATSSVAFYAGVRADLLQWLAPEYNGLCIGAPCTLQSYRVYYGTNAAPKTDPGAMVSPVIPAGTLTFQAPGLNWGARYYYVVVAVYDVGESGPSNEASAMK